MRKINQIILHCAATPEGKNFTVEDIDRWHRQQGWKMIGYHWVIYIDGSIHQGRPEEMIGAHCTGQNKDSIGISYVGGCDKKGFPKDTRTEEQKIALVHLVSELMDKYSLTLDDVHLHREYANKACPSFTKDDFIADFHKYNNEVLR